MIIFPRSKINLGLRVVEKRNDGYHNIESLFYDITHPSDILEIVESDTLSLFLYGNRVDGELDDNIVIKAFNLLKNRFKLPGAEIHLYKAIPVGAGLGGGSSDAAATLLLLNSLFNLNLSKEELAKLSLELGSDCPYFIYSNSLKEGEHLPMLVRGRGEIFETIPLPSIEQFEIKIITSNIFISTAEAYAQVVPKRVSLPLTEIVKMPIEMWREYLYNDFEEVIFKNYPQLEETKKRLYEKGAVYVSMTGSGSALYALFKK